MWQSTKTVSRDGKRAHKELKDSIEDYQKQSQVSLEEILSEIRKMQDKTEDNAQRLFDQIDILKNEIEDINQKVDEIRLVTRDGLSDACIRLRECNNKIIETNQQIKEFSDEIKTDISLVEEGTRLVISNMLLNEMGG